ncbi:MAG: ribosome maturation factor RimM [Kangiellaceae bacterium]|nr:ribosome maturation factor RimM [Kangiellaceae bacterium]
MKNTAPEKKPIIVGQISGVFGVHGWVKVFSHTDPRNNILKYNPWFIKQKDGWKAVKLLKGRKQGKTIVAHLENIEGRDAAHSLIGCDIAIDESQLKKLEVGDFYWRDLEGLKVYSTQNEELGTITAMMATGANDVMVVKLTSEFASRRKDKDDEMLIPYLFDTVVKEVNLEDGLIKVDWDEEFDG